MSERDRPRHLRGLERYVSSGVRTVRWEGIELVGRRKDGVELPIEVAFAEAVVGGRRSFTGTIRDVSERKRFEAQLLQSQKMEAIGQLAGGIAHDFNNILTAVSGYADLLLDDIEPIDPRRSDVEEIERAARRATTLVGQLMTFGRRQRLNPERVDLNEVVERLDPMLRRLIGEHIAVTWLPAAELWPVEADGGQLEQVIVNLSVNARDAMPTGGRLTIETANIELDAEYARTHVDVEPGPHVMLAVSDTGQGMDAATQQRVFEPFFTTKAAGQGTGLGLATVYGIIRQSGGHVWLYSELGRGTTFKIYLPRSTAASLVEPAAAVESAPEGGPETILVAEDEPAVRSLIEKILSRLGYAVLLAEDAAAALQLAGTRPVDLLVADVIMPGRSGLELATDIRSLAPDVRVLFISGYTMGAVKQHGLLGPDDPMLEKPFTPERLARAVRDALASGDGEALASGDGHALAAAGLSGVEATTASGSSGTGRRIDSS